MRLGAGRTNDQAGRGGWDAPSYAPPSFPNRAPLPKHPFPSAASKEGKGRSGEAREGRLQLLPPPIRARRQPTLAFTKLEQRLEPCGQVYQSLKNEKNKSHNNWRESSRGGLGRVERTQWAPGLAHVHSGCITAGASAPVWEDANWPQCWGFSLWPPGPLLPGSEPLSLQRLWALLLLPQPPILSLCGPFLPVCIPSNQDDFPS